MENNQKEITFFEDKNVIVTQSRYIAGSKTYVLRNISSVSILKINKSRTSALILLVIGVVMLSTDLTKFLGVLLSAIGFIWLVAIKNEYAVRITTNAGELNSLTSKDYKYIESIVKSINEAIILRG